MNKYKVLLFDLDGTISDSKEGITKSVQYALKKLGIEEDDLNNLEPFIGPPLQESFRAFYSFTEERVNLAIEYYRERFKIKGMFENKLYPDIVELLHKLRTEGYILVVATSKPTEFAEKILLHFNISQYFNVIVGSNLDGTRINKTEIIEHILNQFNEFDKSCFLMIGDRKHDIIGARNTGIDSLGVTYGYGSHMELQQENATYIVHSVEEIKEILNRIGENDGFFCLSDKHSEEKTR
ncbi:HAD family hydrolase [Aneurinibacillus uraniidurans]|uniref:HAD family hydrolase n=1 Tax=Aneurinibacillus uraniidurans TaxID=2966586 RepID=UPI002349019C|nr:HAD family hydrolase [Aneurinibacillus sp. B1]WCN38391.1 HAD family hydrolase [Aneurinibacillus sp. B1]